MYKKLSNDEWEENINFYYIGTGLSTLFYTIIIRSY